MFGYLGVCLDIQCCIIDLILALDFSLPSNTKEARTMVRVGVVGFGFMGNMHFRCYEANDNAKVAAICDADESKFKGGGPA